MLDFEFRSLMPAPAEALFQYHAQPGAFQRLMPPWQRLELLGPPPPIQNESEVRFRIHQGPLRIGWTARHSDVIPGEQFIDEQIRGPFKHWHHCHQFKNHDQTQAYLEDRIRVSLPFGPLGRWFGGSLLENQLERLFRFRHNRTQRDLQRHRQIHGIRTILIAGGLPSWCHQLAYFMSVGGHRVFRLMPSNGGRYKMQPFLGGSACHPLEECDALLLTGLPEPADSKHETGFDYLDFLADALATLGQRPERLIRIMPRLSGHADWQKDPHLPEFNTSRHEFEHTSYAEKVDRLRQLITSETRLHFGALIEPDKRKLTRLLLQLETFLFLGDHAHTPEFCWIAREDVLSSILFLLDRPDIEGDIALIHPQTATRADLQRSFLRHFYWHYAIGRMFQVVGWAAPGQSPTLNQHLRQFPSLDRWGFQFECQDLASAFQLEFGFSKPASQ